MSLHTYIERLKYVDYLICREATGDAKTLAKKLHLSRSYTLSFLKEMKEIGFPIEYCRKKCSYYYSEDGKLVRDFFEKHNDLKTEIKTPQGLAKDELQKITGGKTFFDLFIQSDYIGLKDNLQGCSLSGGGVEITWKVFSKSLK